MIRHLFERKAGPEAELLAEAQALLDDGLDLDFVLGLFPDDAEWLQPLLTVSTGITEAFAAEQPSYYFEASLKSQFLGAAREPKPLLPVIMPAPAYSPVRTAVASMSVAGVAAGLGVLALGFITAGSSVPGDWNYTFKLANERLEYTLSRGDGRVDIQLHQVENRVYELQKLSSRGDVSQAQLERIQRDIDDLKATAQQNDLDEMQRARLEGLGRQGKSVVVEIAQKQPSIPQETVNAAAAALDDITTLAASGPREIPTPTATASPTSSATPVTTTPAPTNSATASPTESATPEPTATATATPSPAESATPEPSTTSTVQPVESETATPAGTQSP
ncbi:MAG: hypothetical protein U0837_07240 [Dehalococcoidia bacterium]